MVDLAFARAMLAMLDRSKRAVKRIRLRMDAIVKKKQATVRLLKKDVADLLAAGHESNAFGRVCFFQVSFSSSTRSASSFRLLLSRLRFFC